MNSIIKAKTYRPSPPLFDGFSQFFPSLFKELEKSFASLANLQNI